VPADPRSGHDLDRGGQHAADLVVDPDVDLGDRSQAAETAPREWDILLAVAIGGVVGADARYGIGRAFPHRSTDFPWSTVLINGSGCLLIGVLMAFVLSRSAPPRLTRPFLGVGILGGYTTYSTFATDVVGLVIHHQPARAAIYLAVTVLSCAAAVWLTTAATESAIGSIRARSARRAA
jgi:CrcB protein